MRIRITVEAYSVLMNEHARHLIYPPAIANEVRRLSGRRIGTTLSKSISKASLERLKPYLVKKSALGSGASATLPGQPDLIPILGRTPGGRPLPGRGLKQARTTFSRSGSTNDTDYS